VRRSDPEGFRHDAPLPAYAFVLLMPLAALPYIAANVAFDLVLLVATILSVIVLSRLTKIPFIVLVPSLTLSLTFQSWRFGQIAPLVLLCLVIAAAALERGRYGVTAAALAAAMIEPHVAFPALLSVFITVPRARLPVAVAAGVLAIAALGAIGIDQNVQYFQDVLPAHAASELHMNAYQFSLTNLLHELGVADRPALEVGELCYVVMIGIGIGISLRLARRTERAALLVLGPCAIALVGGLFLHLVQIACALPFALMLLALFPRDRFILFATLLLAAPWLELMRNSDPASVALSVAVAVAPLAAYALRDRPWQAMAVSCALIGLGAGIEVFISTIHLSKIDATAALARVKDGRLLAEASWATYVNTVLSRNPPSYIIEKMPTWMGLCALLIGATAQALASRSTPVMNRP
jgi:hypothetical protein